MPPPNPTASARPAATSRMFIVRARRSGAFEGVTGRDLAGLHAGHEPARALLRRAVREAFGHDPALGAALDRVVADRRRRRHGLFDVAGLEQLAVVRVVRPYAGETVGLQLE